MSPIVIFIILWYLVGVLCFVRIFWVEHYEGEDVLVGDVVGALAVSVVGPILVVPVLIDYGFKGTWVTDIVEKVVIRGKQQ